MKLTLRIAQTRAEVLRCQYFIAEKYHRLYGITFSQDLFNLEARIEPYPHRYLMASVGGELVGTIGLYEHDTYVERYGAITDPEVAALLEQTGAAAAYPTSVRRELTKLVVRDGWGHLGVARAILDVAFSRAFLETGAAHPVLVLVCGRRSLLDGMLWPGGVVRSHYLAPFPRYPMHARYRQEADPMESRLIIPAVDVPEAQRAHTLPRDVELPGEPPPQQED